MSTEKLHFKIGISGTYWDKQPYFLIGVNDTPYHIGSVTEPSDTIFYVEFDAEVPEGENILKVMLRNKELGDTVKDCDDPVNFKIVKDMLLNIHSVEIDDIDLGMIVFMESTFKLDNPYEFNGETVSELAKCVNLGFNGTWELKFNSPFYLWLLEKM